jgi:hypothetical protein
VALLRFLTLTAALAVLAVAPAAAQAAPFPPRLNFAYELALDYWHQSPAACRSIDKEIVPPGSLGNAEIGAVSGRSTHVPAGSPPGSIDCILWIDRAYAEPIIFDLLCAVVVHGVGHLLGMEYSPDPRSVMNESIPVPELCKVKGRQSARLYLLRLKYHWLQTQHGTKVARLRSQAHRQISREAARFWSAPNPGLLSGTG